MSWGEKAAEASDARWFADLLFEVVHEIRPRRFYGRAEAEKHCREKTKQKCRRQHGRIRAQFHDDGEISGSQQTTELLKKKIVAPGTDHEPDRATAKSKQKALAEQLSYDLPARRPHREPDGNLFRTRRAAREQHVGQIQARYKQNRPSHGHE